jgi:hypothetical protein
MKDEVLHEREAGDAFVDHQCTTALCRGSRVLIGGQWVVIDAIVGDGVQGPKFAICHVEGCER